MRIRTGFQDEESSEEFSPGTETFNELPEDVMDIISRPGTWYFNTQHPGEMIREILNAYKTPHLEGLPTFTEVLWDIFPMSTFSMVSLH